MRSSKTSFRSFLFLLAATAFIGGTTVTLPSPALGAPRLDAPETLVQRARRSPEEFIAVIFELENQLPEMRSRQEFEPYFNTLTKLEAISETLPNLGADTSVFKRVAGMMAVVGIRWVSLETDSVETILTYHRWLDFSAAYDFLADTELLLRKKKDDRELREKAVAVMSALQAWAAARNAPPFLINGYRGRISEVALMAFKDHLTSSQFSEEERIRWTDRLLTEESQAGVLSDLFSLIVGLSPGMETQAHLYADILEHLALRSRDAQHPFPAYIQINISDSIMRIIVEKLRFGFSFRDGTQENGEFARLTGLLRPAQLSALAFEWINIDQSRSDSGPDTPSASWKQFLAYARILETRLERAQMSMELKTFREYWQKAGAATVSDNMDFSGTYLLTADNGRTYRFTVFTARRGQLVAGLGDPGEAFRVSFTQIFYNPTTGVFTGSEHDMSNWTGSNHTVRFRFDGDRVFCQFPNLSSDMRRLTGVRVAKFTDYASLPATGSPERVPGEFRGVLRHTKPQGLENPVDLEINQVGKTYVGRLNIHSGKDLVIRVHFNLGNVANTDGLVQLTSTDTQHTMHLRGRIEGDRFVGEYIVAGRGLQGTLDLTRRTLPPASDLA